MATVNDAADIINLKQAFTDAGQSWGDRNIALGLDDLATEGQWQWDDGAVKLFF